VEARVEITIAEATASQRAAWNALWRRLLMPDVEPSYPKKGRTESPKSDAAATDEAEA
jgi:hypothetical protein